MQLTEAETEMLLAQVEYKDAHYVLRECGYTHGTMEPGEFYRRLTHAIAVADPRNRARLHLAGFGGLTSGMNLIQGSPRGVALLRRRAGIPCPTCHGTGMVRDVEQTRGPDGHPRHLKDCPVCHGDTIPPPTTSP